ASREQRLALLSGLCDADGFATTQPNGTGSLEFTSTSRDLAESALFLARSLGIKAMIREGRATLDGRDMGAKFRIVMAVSRQNAPLTFSRRLAALPSRSPSQRSMRDAV